MHLSASFQAAVSSCCQPRTSDQYTAVLPTEFFQAGWDAPKKKRGSQMQMSIDFWINIPVALLLT